MAIHRYAKDQFESCRFSKNGIFTNTQMTALCLEAGILSIFNISLHSCENRNKLEDIKKSWTIQ